MHRDIKSQNFLVSAGSREDGAARSGARFTLKLSDFGETRLYSPGHTEPGAIGTLQWMAPEVMAGLTGYTPSIDVYSYAMVLWELVTYDHPFRGLRDDAVVYLVQNGYRPSIPPDCPPDYVALLQACWSPEPYKRPSAAALVAALSRMVVAERRELRAARTARVAGRAPPGAR